MQGRRGGAVAPRLAFLDALRGVAALAVVLSHMGERILPGVDAFISSVLQLGQLGVTLFFICSGFIIPVSLERRGLQAFWLSRLFRLYPLYWFVIFVLLALHLAGLWHEPPGFTHSDWLANLTMVHGFAGVPDVLGVLWSLRWEMLFYMSMTVLFAAGLHRCSVAIASVALTLANLDAAVGLLPQLDWYPLWWTWMAQLFTGTVLYRYFTGSLGRWPLTAVLVYYVLTMVNVTHQFMWGKEWPPGHGTWSFWPMCTAWVGALFLFLAALAGRRLAVPPALTWLGTVSYSIYMVHLVVMDVGRQATESYLLMGSPAATAVLWLAVTLALATLCYHCVELPFIRLGRRVVRRLRPRRQLRPTGSMRGG